MKNLLPNFMFCTQTLTKQILYFVFRPKAFKVIFGIFVMDQVDRGCEKHRSLFWRENQKRQNSTSKQINVCHVFLR